LLIELEARRAHDVETKQYIYIYIHICIYIYICV
jgi:hypothetical protein